MGLFAFCCASAASCLLASVLQAASPRLPGSASALSRVHGGRVTNNNHISPVFIGAAPTQRGAYSGTWQFGNCMRLQEIRTRPPRGPHQDAVAEAHAPPAAGARPQSRPSPSHAIDATSVRRVRSRRSSSTCTRGSTPSRRRKSPRRRRPCSGVQAPRQLQGLDAHKFDTMWLWGKNAIGRKSIISYT